MEENKDTNGMTDHTGEPSGQAGAGPMSGDEAHGVVPPTNANSGAAGQNIEAEDQPKLDQAQQEAQQTEAPTPLQLRAHQSEIETTGTIAGMSNRVPDDAVNVQSKPGPASSGMHENILQTISDVVNKILPTHTISRLSANDPSYVDKLIAHFASELRTKLTTVPSR